MLKTATIDQRHRPLQDLRISVTDRCNLRCQYCLPEHVFGPDFRFLPKSQLLSYEELTELARAFVTLGVKKIRLTGGEPLLRNDVYRLVEQLSAIDKKLDLALTTNGIKLAEYAQQLRSAGLNRVNISLDALDTSILQQMSGRKMDSKTVLDAIRIAKATGLKVKVNMVVKRGVNEREILPMVKQMHQLAVSLRFIEYMDVGESNHWSAQDVVSGNEILKHLQEHFELQPVAGNASDTAKRYCHTNGTEVGFINSITQAFCSGCTRARISAEGKLYTCLFAEHGHDLKAWIRDEKLSSKQIHKRLSHLWQMRNDHYSEIRTQERQHTTHHPEMWTIGG